MQKRKQVLVVDDHPLILNSIKGIVEGLFFDVTAKINAKEALGALSAKHFDLVLLDIDLPDMDGKSLLSLIRMNHKTTSVLIVSGTLGTQEVTWMLNNGAQGYIDKAVPADELKEAIIQVANDGSYIPYEIQSAVEHVIDKKEMIRKHLGITLRQLDVIHLLAKGLSNKEIADELNIAKATVDSHLKDIYVTLKVNNRTACVDAAKKLGLI